MKKQIIVTVLAVLLISACSTTVNKNGTDVVTEFQVQTRMTNGPEPTGFQPVKAEQTEGSLNENVVVVAEKVLNEDSFMLKKATVQPVGEENFSAWQLLCDEGGDDYEQTAPNPLSYLTVGIGSNLLTQVQRGIEVMGLDVDDVRVETKVYFRWDDLFTKQWSGYTDKVVANILIDSIESPETIAELKELALSSWTAGEGMANATEILPELIINGQHWDADFSTNGFVSDDISVDKGLTISAKTAQPVPETFGLEADAGGDFGKGDSIEFVVFAIAESADDSDRAYLNKVTVRALQDNYAAWDLYVDDSYGFDGIDKAPTSLDYLTAGTANCLMSQLAINDMYFFLLKIKDYRVEQQISYRQENYMTPEMAGYADTVISKVIVNSNGSEKALTNFFVQSLRCCFAGEAFMNETEVVTDIYQNGNIIK